uniref:S1 motif domain-containing protein n=1 Tax=viral metagenome TaxID=1070528 RepID=A0A6C0KUN6_9ZZZZ
MNQLTKSICISPELLTQDIRQNIFSVLKEKFEGIALKEDGFVSNIQNDFRILNNFVSPSMASQIIFKVCFRADVLKPEIGNCFTGKVIAVDERAVIVSVENKMNILIPATRLPDFSFDKTKMTFDGVWKGAKKKIKVGDEICAEIIAIRFEKKFICIGKLN